VSKAPDDACASRKENAAPGRTKLGRIGRNGGSAPHCGKGALLKLRAGEQIICDQGHVCGKIIREFAADSPITQEDLSFIHRQTSLSNYHFDCATCGEIIAEASNEMPPGLTVRVTRGWIR
jgi:hypothetical protein